MHEWSFRSSRLQHKIETYLQVGLCDTNTNSTFKTDKSQCRQRFKYFNFMYSSRTMSKEAPRRGIELNVDKLRIPKQMWSYKNVVIWCVYGVRVCVFPPSFI